VTVAILLAACLTLLALSAACGDGYSRAEVKANLGRELAEDGDWEGAIDEYSEAIRVGEPSAPVLFARGFAYLQVGEYAPAGADFTAAISVDPGLAEAYRYRITADMVTGNIDRAFHDSAVLARIWAGPALTVQ
jgi:tetratricopeptide (TPR) repeat protein